MEEVTSGHDSRRRNAAVADMRVGSWGQASVQCCNERERRICLYRSGHCPSLNDNSKTGTLQHICISTESLWTTSRGVSVQGVGVSVIRRSGGLH